MPDKTIFIATPCYGGLVYYSYLRSLLDTVVHLNNHGIGVKIAGMGNESLITRARNQMVAQFLASDCTHLMWIDADITWDGKDIMKLLNADKDVIGGVYPMKDYFWGRAENAYHESFDADNSFNPDLFRSKLMAYPVNYLPGQDIESRGGLIKVKHLPTGFMMVKRSVFEKMIKKWPEMKLTQDSNRDPALAPWLYNFYDCMVEPTSGIYLSEDFAFCHRYLNLDRENNELYADISIGLTHTGTHDFRGHYGLSLLPKNTLK